MRLLILNMITINKLIHYTFHSVTHVLVVMVLKNLCNLNVKLLKTLIDEWYFSVNSTCLIIKDLRVCYLQYLNVLQNRT